MHIISLQLFLDSCFNQLLYGCGYEKLCVGVLFCEKSEKMKSEKIVSMPFLIEKIGQEGENIEINCPPNGKQTASNVNT